MHIFGSKRQPAFFNSVKNLCTHILKAIIAEPDNKKKTRKSIKLYKKHIVVRTAKYTHPVVSRLKGFHSFFSALSFMQITLRCYFKRQSSLPWTLLFTFQSSIAHCLFKECTK